MIITTKYTKHTKIRFFAIIRIIKGETNKQHHKTNRFQSNRPVLPKLNNKPTRSWLAFR